jgi:hypothetical protein
VKLDLSWYDGGDEQARNARLSEDSRDLALNPSEKKEGTWHEKRLANFPRQNPCQVRE